MNLLAFGVEWLYTHAIVMGGENLLAISQIFCAFQDLIVPAKYLFGILLGKADPSQWLTIKVLLRIRIDKDVDAAIIQPLSKILASYLFLVNFFCLDT